MFSLRSCCGARNFVLLSGTILPTFDCVLLNVYAPNEVSRRKCLWDTIIRLKLLFVFPWCPGGDFNEIRNLGKRKECSVRSRGMREFNQFIESVEVSDLPMLGRKFTWCNALEGDKWSRIDRFLISPEWLGMFNCKV